jgi:hypothetical protein
MFWRTDEGAASINRMPNSVSSQREQILQHVHDRYGSRADAALRELDRYTGTIVADQNRVHQAILHLTNGTLDNLSRWVDVALYDYRDVLGLVENANPAAADEVRRFNDFRLEQDAFMETSFEGLVDE